MVSASPSPVFHYPAGRSIGWPVITFFQKSQGLRSAPNVLPGADSKYRHKTHELDKFRAPRPFKKIQKAIFQFFVASYQNMTA